MKKILPWVTMSFWTLCLSLFWLPLVRTTFDGQSYRWAFEFFGHAVHGRGWDDNFWFLILANVISFFILVSGWRGWRNIFALTAVPVATLLTVDSTQGLLLGKGLTFEGVTLGMVFNATTIYFVLAMALTLTSLFYLKIMQPRVWHPRGKLLLSGALTLLPLQFLLLYTSAMTEPGDIIGVLLTLGQFVLVSAAISLSRPPSL